MCGGTCPAHAHAHASCMLVRVADACWRHVRNEIAQSKNGTASPAANRTFWTSWGTPVAAARPVELADAALPEAEAVLAAVLLAVLEEAVEEAVLLKLSSLVKTAVSPVAFVQLELTVVLTPVTKLTGAHW